MTNELYMAPAPQFAYACYQRSIHKSLVLLKVFSC